MVLDEPFTTAAPAIATFSFTEFSTNEGTIIYMPYITQNASVNEWAMSSNAISSTGTTGLLGARTVDFMSPKFNITQTIAAVFANLTGFADYSAATLTIAATLYKMNFDKAEAGSIIASDLNEVTETSASFVLKKTVSVNDFVYQTQSDAKKTPAAAGNLRQEYVYTDGSTASVDTVLTDAFVTYTYTNPYPQKKVTSVKIYLNATGANTTTEDETKVYNILNLNETVISNTVTSQDVGADQMFSIILTLTRTVIRVGESIRLNVVVSGASGGFIVDPNNSNTSSETMKLYIPLELHT